MKTCFVWHLWIACFRWFWLKMVEFLVKSGSAFVGSLDFCLFLVHGCMIRGFLLRALGVISRPLWLWSCCFLVRLWAFWGRRHSLIPSMWASNKKRRMVREEKWSTWAKLSPAGSFGSGWGKC